MRGIVVPFFIAHLGCPHRCVFCDQEKIAGAVSVLPDPAEMLEKIRQYRASAPGRAVEVAFFGGTFTALPRVEQERLLEPLQPLLAEGVVSAVRLSTRPDAVDAGTASFLKVMGVGTVELGVQSMDQEVLDLSGRGHSVADVEAAFGHLQGAGIRTGAQLMPGLPGDTPERSMTSCQRVLALDPACLRIYPTLVLAGTDLARRYRRGEYTPLTLDDAVALSGRMLVAAQRRGVPVIRIGLQPTAELESPGALLAGPYHPAFGQLVESELFYHLLCRLAGGVSRGSRVTLFAAPGRISDVVGHKRRNLERLAERFDVEVKQVREDTRLARTEVTLCREDEELRGDILELA